MTFLPVAPWPVLLVVAVALLVGVWWNPSSRDLPGESRSTHWRLTAVIVLLGVAALRPAVPGDEVDTTAANVNVYFVVDTTTSIVAEDYGNERPRVEGVQADIAAIARELPGARYSVITFDSDSRVRLPLTTDTTALEAALETLAPEPSEYSRGTSVSQANDRLATLLTQSDQRYPERGRVVFYFGDGEHTAAGEPAPFDVPEGLINGGSVLGYGTTEGGRMAATRARFGGGDGSYLKDPATGEDARSVFSEPTLRAIGDQLRLPYLHRDAGESIEPAVETIDLTSFGTSAQIEAQKVRARRELYWPLLFGVAGLAVWEVGMSLTSLAQTRRRKEAQP